MASVSDMKQRQGHAPDAGRSQCDLMVSQWDACEVHTNQPINQTDAWVYLGQKDYLLSSNQGIPL